MQLTLQYPKSRQHSMGSLVTVFMVMVITALFLTPLQAQDKQVIKLKNPLNSEQVLEEKADVSRQQANKTEQEQLEKARQANQALSLREQKILHKHQNNTWQIEQQGKAEQGFKDRKNREQVYLDAAQRAATQDKKITTPKEAVDDNPAQPKQD